MNSLVVTGERPAEAAGPVIRLTGPRLRRRSLVSLTPLIDVVFILLIFFMLASNFFEWRQLTFSTTVAEHSGSGTGEGAHVVLDSKGTLTLDGQTMALKQLCTTLSSRLNGQPALPVLLQPQAGVSVQEMMSVFDRLVAAGAFHLSLVVTPDAANTGVDSLTGVTGFGPRDGGHSDERSFENSGKQRRWWP